MIKRRPIVIDLFAGAGGLSEGLHLAGWDVAIAIEKDQNAADTYEFNQNTRQRHNTKLLRTDITNLTESELSKALTEARGITLGDVDFVAGGPPCQGFSVIGPRSLDDVRNRLFLEYIRVVQMVRPKAFIAENVRGILSFAGRRMPKLLHRIFNELGYNLTYEVINAFEYGVPQDRVRVIFMGIRKDVANKLGIRVLRAPAPYLPDYIKEFYPSGYRITVKDALSDLPLGKAMALKSRIWVNDEEVMSKDNELFFSYPLDREVTPYQYVMRRQSSVIYDNHTKGMSKERLQKVRHIPEGGTLSSKGRSNSWRRLSRNRHCHTLQAHMGKDLKEFIHPTIDRWITVREAARLQSFDDSYRFLGSQCAQLTQVGNAVPPFLGWAIGCAIGEQLGFSLKHGFPLRDAEIKEVNSCKLNTNWEEAWFKLLGKSASIHECSKLTNRVIQKLYSLMTTTAIKEKQEKESRKSNSYSSD
ncbi:MAG: DNA cytosine methyltransferase [Bacillota bacterium]